MLRLAAPDGTRLAGARELRRNLRRRRSQRRGLARRLRPSGPLCLPRACQRSRRVRGSLPPRPRRRHLGRGRRAGPARGSTSSSRAHRSGPAAWSMTGPTRASPGQRPTAMPGTGSSTAPPGSTRRASRLRCRQPRRTRRWLAVRAARAAGATVSVDLNYRAKLWGWGASAGDVMAGIVAEADVLIGNEEDADKVFGIRAPGSSVADGTVDPAGYASVAAALSERFPRLHTIAFTQRGSISASENTWSGVLWTRDTFHVARSYRIAPIVDRVGAGDSFAAGPDLRAARTGARSDAALEFAVAASCLKHTIRGDVNQVSVVRGRRARRRIRVGAGRAMTALGSPRCPRLDRRDGRPAALLLGRRRPRPTDHGCAARGRGPGDRVHRPWSGRVVRLLRR